MRDELARLAAESHRLLRELSANEEWELLEFQARRALASTDPVLDRLATRRFAEALMHSDEGPKRAQATAIAEQLLVDGAAGEDEYLLAAAAFEVDGEPARSISASTTWFPVSNVSTRTIPFALMTANSSSSIGAVQDGMA